MKQFVIGVVMAVGFMFFLAWGFTDQIDRMPWWLNLLGYVLAMFWYIISMALLGPTLSTWLRTKPPKVT